MKFFGFFSGISVAILFGLTWFFFVKIGSGYALAYLMIFFIIVGGAIGLFAFEFMIQALIMQLVILALILIPAYLIFTKSIQDIRDITNDIFIVQAEDKILRNLKVNVRYFINDQKNPLYTVFYKVNNYEYDHRYNNIKAEKYEVFVNYANNLFANFIVYDVDNCENGVFADTDSKAACWDESLLNFTIKDNDIFLGCNSKNKLYCQKLKPLANIDEIPFDFTYHQSIGNSLISKNKEQRSFLYALGLDTFF